MLPGYFALPDDLALYDVFVLVSSTTCGTAILSASLILK